MRTIIGIDLGLSKTGVARAVGPLAEPLTVIHEKNMEQLAQKIGELAKTEGAKEIIIGIPEGEIETIAQKIGHTLRQKNVEIVFWDETLSTQDAQAKAIAAGVPQKRRKALEDSFAAAIMLQSYLDNV